MRLDEQQIKQAILHPNPEIRLKAIKYFTDSHSDDPSVMPVVIESVQQHGRGAALFGTLRRAETLAQSPPTIDWMIDELQLDCDRSDKTRDNYLLAVALILYSADPALIVDRRDRIVSSPGFHEKLIPLLDGRLKLHTASWRECWDKLVEFCHSHPDDEPFTLSTTRTANDIVDALGRKLVNDREARHACLAEYSVLEQGGNEWLGEWSKVRLTGAMRDHTAIPWLLDTMALSDNWICDEAVTALSRIGTDETVQQIAALFPDADEVFRNYATESLQHIHADSVVDVCLRLLVVEEDTDVAISLGHALLGHFDDQAIEPVYELLLELGPEGFDAEGEGLLYDLLETSTIMDRKFPEFTELWAFAEERNWGWGEYEDSRLSDTFFDESQTLEGAVHKIMSAAGHPEPVEFEDLTATRSGFGHKKPGRNDPCPCGSGKKYKKCCLNTDDINPLLN